jgi:hypothetical protein
MKSKAKNFHTIESEQWNRGRTATWKFGIRNVPGATAPMYPVSLKSTERFSPHWAENSDRFQSVSTFDFRNSLWPQAPILAWFFNFFLIMFVLSSKGFMLATLSCWRHGVRNLHEQSTAAPSVFPSTPIDDLTQSVIAARGPNGFRLPSHSFGRNVGTKPCREVYQIGTAFRFPTMNRRRRALTAADLIIGHRSN